MTEREEFEQWASMPPRNLSVERYSVGSAVTYGMVPGDYKVEKVRDMWKAWHAATDASTHKAIYEDEV